MASQNSDRKSVWVWIITCVRWEINEHDDWYFYFNFESLKLERFSVLLLEFQKMWIDVENAFEVLENSYLSTLIFQLPSNFLKDEILFEILYNTNQQILHSN